MDIIDTVKRRYACKAFSSRPIPEATAEKLKTLLRLSPSSVNLQPWRFVIAHTEEGKARVVKAADPSHAFNAKSIRLASHVIVGASLIHADEAYLRRITDQEEADGRFDGDKEAQKAGAYAGRSRFTDLHQVSLNDGPEWHARQSYLALGQLLLGAAALGLDAVPMEGLDFDILDAEFGFPAAGYRARWVTPVGYADEAADRNRTRPKSRLPEAAVITEI